MNNNFFRDNPDILFHLKENFDLARVIDLREDYFAEKDHDIAAPQDRADALDNYERVLEIVGEIAGAFIAPRADSVDKEGSHFADGVVTHARGTQENLDALKKAELMGFTLPRRYGGLQMPKFVYTMAIEMISRADASLMNLFGLQEIADTIFKFGSEDQRARYLPRFSSGEVMGSMALTEPDSGSDLQSIALRASQDSAGTWRLSGVKRFITNGCAEISLVMARSEDGSRDGRGVSLFIYERDEDMKIRRIEHKLGIHGSPTCELQFNNARCELLGQRRLGLIKYTMSLMNGARLGVSAQALGIAEAAYREAEQYSKSRVQFKKRIREFTAISEMLVDMRAAIEAGRTLLYETALIVDVKEGIEERLELHPELASDLKNDLASYTQLAALYTPMCKCYNTEMANKACYDALQIHGGVGFTTEFPVERLARDARITNIYEGTTQLQVVAAIGGIMKGILFERLNAYENGYDFASRTHAPLMENCKSMRTMLERAVTHVKEKNSNDLAEYHARRLVEMGADVTCCYLLTLSSLRSERKLQVAQAFMAKAKHRLRAHLDFILEFDENFLNSHLNIIE